MMINSLGVFPGRWSPLTESNRRPSPYHGDALPTELRGPAWPRSGSLRQRSRRASRAYTTAARHGRASPHGQAPARDACSPTQNGLPTEQHSACRQRVRTGRGTPRGRAHNPALRDRAPPPDCGRHRTADATGLLTPPDCGNTRNLVPWPHNGRASGHEPTSADRSSIRTQQADLTEYSREAYTT
jgi:hypothetical protein